MDYDPVVRPNMTKEQVVAKISKLIELSLEWGGSHTDRCLLPE